MKQRWKWMMAALLLTAGIAFSLVMADVFLVETSPGETYAVSMVVRGAGREGWDSIRQGAEQAAEEMGGELSFITLAEENNVFQQESLLYREVDSGAQALILSAADSKFLGDVADTLAGKTPVICVESPVDSQSVSAYISADNYGMGQSLGREMLRSGNVRKRLAVVEWGLESQAVAERREGLFSVLDPIGGEVQIWTLPYVPGEARDYLADRMKSGEVDVVVALDVYVLELAGQALVDTGLQESLSLFGIGAGTKAAEFLEQGVIEAAVAQNDFAIGYLGVKSALDQLAGRMVTPVTTVEHLVVTAENMYDPQVQRLLFPFVR